MNKKQILENAIYKLVKNVLNEGVYINGIKGNKANLTYKKGQRRNIGSINATDKLVTDKMDENNADTYEIKLKGGITSYNITSIVGTEVMHYFKNYFKRQKTNIELKTKDGEKKEYELSMEENEFRQFLWQFLAKVGYVIQYYLGKVRQSGDKTEFTGISVYPVKSSSNFNTEMVKQITGLNLLGLPIQAIDESLFLKDLRNLQKDTEFIEKNKEYYNSPLSNTKGNKQPVINYVDKNIERNNALKPAETYLKQMSDLSRNIVQQLYNYRLAQKQDGRTTPRIISSMAKNYKQYFDLYIKCLSLKYKNPVTKEDSSINLETFAEQMKYSKGPSIEERTKEVWHLIKPYLRGVKSINGLPYKEIPLQTWVYKGFQIKNLTNGERMGLKNIYNTNPNSELVQQELEKIKGTVFVIFDDNISGGATLSDICYQAKNLGIKYIIPITFGKMEEKWTMRNIPLNKPEGGFNL